MQLPEELGLLGENHLREICGRARLICNESAHQDIAGWDFIVQFKMNYEDNISFDRIKPPTQCLIQVKSISANTKSIKLRLNMAQRLAFEAIPTYIYVVKINETDNIVKAYLIHLSGSRLETILKRLRFESSINEKKINEKYISMTPRKSEQIDIDGISLKNALEAQCGNNSFQYLEEKQKQLKKLGYDENPYRGTMQIVAKSNEELSDIFLGIKPLAEVRNLKLYETRFGIELPEHEAEKASITITAHPTDTCNLTIIINKSPIRKTIKGKVFTYIDKYFLRQIWDFDFFIIDVQKNESLNISILLKENENKKTTIKNWIIYFEIFERLKNNDGYLEIIFNKTEKPLIINSKSLKNFKCQWNNSAIIELLEIFEKITFFSGCSEDAPISIEDIIKNQIALYNFNEIYTNKYYSFKFNPSENYKKYLIPEKTVIGFYINFTDFMIAYYATAIILLNSTKEGEVKNLKLKKCIKLSEHSSARESFISQAKEAENIPFYCEITETGKNQLEVSNTENELPQIDCDQSVTE